MRREEMWKLLKLTKNKIKIKKNKNILRPCCYQTNHLHSTASDLPHGKWPCQEFCAALPWPSQLSLWKQPSLSKHNIADKNALVQTKIWKLYSLHFRSLRGDGWNTVWKGTSWITVSQGAGSFSPKFDTTPPRLLEKIIDLNKKQEIQRNWWTWRISPLVWLVFLRFFGARFSIVSCWEPPGPVMPWTYTMLYGIIFGTAVKTWTVENAAGCLGTQRENNGKSAGDSIKQWICWKTWFTIFDFDKMSFLVAIQRCSKHPIVYLQNLGRLKIVWPKKNRSFIC